MRLDNSQESLREVDSRAKTKKRLRKQIQLAVVHSIGVRSLRREPPSTSGGNVERNAADWGAFANEA